MRGAGANDLSFERFIEKFNELTHARHDFVVVTLTHIEGSAPQNLGARLIASENGLEFGTIGGGKIEAFALMRAQEILASNQGPAKFSLSLNLQTDIKMSCGGKVNLLFEVFGKKMKWTIAVMGAGHVAQSLVPMLLQLGCQVQVWDPREDWIQRFAPHPWLKCQSKSTFQSFLDGLPETTFLVCMTMGHATDLPILKWALAQYNFPYVGCMGSELKAKKLRNELVAEGLDPTRIEQLRCPIGERFGDNSPLEISYSVIAELLRVRDQFFLNPHAG